MRTLLAFISLISLVAAVALFVKVNLILAAGLILFALSVHIEIGLRISDTVRMMAKWIDQMTQWIQQSIGS